MKKTIKRITIFSASMLFYVLGYLLEVDPLRIDSGITAGALVLILMEIQNDD